MSYEGKMLEDFAMPTRKKVEQALLKTLFKHNGVIKEFATGEEIVNEIADEFSLDKNQRTAVLERIYRKENRNVHFWIVSVLAVMYYATAAGGMLFIVVLCCIDMLLTKKITKELVAEKIPFFLLAVISFSVSNISLVKASWR